MREEDNNILINVIIGLFSALIISIIFYLYYKGEYKKPLNGETIGLATRIKQGRPSTLRYYFYVDEKRILGRASLANPDLVNKFYRVKYDLNSPEKGHAIILNEELQPDSITLVKAGFTKTKYYIYDAGVTCKYIENSKWK
ncbi:hypothetical protein [Flavobacterium sp. FlaQc-47]|uniref:hypothetical protein n=1 Tax=Flavobacterium sp. FlaQc-47 TaxID=3374180 RepID=UPI003757B4FC